MLKKDGEGIRIGTLVENHRLDVQTHRYEENIVYKASWDGVDLTLTLSKKDGHWNIQNYPDQTPHKTKLLLNRFLNASYQTLLEMHETSYPILLEKGLIWLVIPKYLYIKNYFSS
mgnify:FL=1